MTDRLFEGTPLACQADARFTAAVTEVRTQGSEVSVVLDRSLFYPTGGGQPCDVGTLDGVDVLEVSEEAGVQLHRLAGDTAVAWGIGRPVVGEVDMARRTDHMQQHSGQHLLSAVLLRDHELSTVSFHLGREVCTIDVTAESVSAAVLARAEACCNAAIQGCLPVRVVVFHGAAAAQVAGTLRKTPDAKALGSERGLRVVELGNVDAPLDRDACCGTHAENLGQLGFLVVLGSERGRKGQTRIQFAVGKRAVAATRTRLQALGEVCRALNTGHADVGERARGVVGQVSEQAKTLKRLEQDAARHAATQLAAEGAAWHVHTVDSSGSKTLTTFAQTYKAAHPEGTLVLLHAGERTSLVLAAGSEAPEGFHAAELLRAWLGPHQGKGGGNQVFAQGTAPDPTSANGIEATAREALGALFS